MTMGLHAMPDTSPDGLPDYATLLLKAAQVCETTRAEISRVLSLPITEAADVIDEALQSTARGISLVSEITKEAKNLPPAPMVDSEVICSREIRDGAARDQFLTSIRALDEGFDQLVELQESLRRMASTGLFMTANDRKLLEEMAAEMRARMAAEDEADDAAP